MENKKNEAVTLTNGTEGKALIRANIALFEGKNTQHIMGTLDTMDALTDLVGEDKVAKLVDDIEDVFNVFSDTACEIILDLIMQKVNETKSRGAN